MTTDEGELLDLRAEQDGLRHYLFGAPVLSGDMLELRLGGVWTHGRYEWNGREGDPPRFFIDNASGALELDLEKSVLRWPRSEVEAGQLLELRKDTGGSRYYLFRKPVHAGELLELQLDDGAWVLGRYEWNHRQEDWPWFYVDTESGDAIHVNPEKANLRWPQSRP